MVAHLQIGTTSTMSHRIGSWKCWFLRRGENRSSRGKTSGSKEPTPNSTLHMWRPRDRLSALTSTPSLHPTPNPPPHGAWWDPGAKFQIRTSGHHILREWWMMPHSLFAFCAWRCYTVSKNVLIKLRDVIPGTFIQPLSTGVIHLTFPVQYLQNK